MFANCTRGIAPKPTLRWDALEHLFICYLTSDLKEAIKLSDPIDTMENIIVFAVLDIKIDTIEDIIVEKERRF